MKVGKLRTRFRLSQKSRSPAQKCDLRIICDYDVIMTTRTLLWHSPMEVINRAKFGVGSPGSFGGAKTDGHTDRISLYISDDISWFPVRSYSLS